MANRFVVLSGYKRLLRTASRAFGNDAEALGKAKIELRQTFENNRNEKDPAALKEMIDGIDDVVDFLNTNIIQAQLKDDGSGDYEVKFTDTQAAAFSQDQVNQIHIMKENELPEEPAKVVSHKKKKD